MFCSSPVRLLGPQSLRLSLAAISLLAAGCGKAPPPKSGGVSVSGVVTYQGKPLADAKIFFFTDKLSTYGMTDAEGKYKLAQGAIPGENKVFVSKMTGDAGAVPAQIADDPGQLAASAAANQVPGARPKKTGPAELLPAEMSDPEKTKLTFSVPAEGTSTANFSL